MMSNSDMRGWLAKTPLLILATFLLTCMGRTSDPEKAKTLALVSQHELQIIEPSGLALDAGGRHLWTVSDATNRVYKIDLSGNIIDSLLYVGDDLEGIAHDPEHGTLWVVEERAREVVELDSVGNEILRRKIPVKQKKRNKGLEGISFYPKTGGLFVLNEKSPKLLLELDKKLEITQEHKLKFAKDYSAIAYDESDDRLWILSDGSRALWLCDLAGQEKQKYTVDIKKPEGVAVSPANGALYIICDTTSKLYVYRRPTDLD